MARGKGEGSIVWDTTNKVWTASVELPAIWDEKNRRWKRRRRKVSSKDKRTAMQKLQKVRREVQRGNLGTRVPTVDEWITKWLEEIAPKKVNPNTIQSYRSALKKHVADRYAGKKLHYLTPGRIRELTANLAEEKSPGTARNVHSYLSHCLADAVGDGLLVEHPMRHLAIPQRPRKAENALSVDSAVHLLKWLGRQIDQQTEHAHLAPLWVAYLLTGARRGELLGLEPDRVGDDTMDVTWQLQRLSADDLASASADYEHRHLQDSYYLVRPKSQSGWRTYPLVEPLRSLVKGVADRTPEGQLVFSSPDGAPLDPDSITRRWKKMLIAAGIESEKTPAKDRVKLHGARHTVADLLDLLEVPEHVMVDLLGHSTRHMTRAYKTRQSPQVRNAMQSIAHLVQTGKKPDADSHTPAALTASQPWHIRTLTL